MALQLPITQSNVGVGFTEAYARITNIVGNKNELQAQVAIHASAAAREAGALEVRQEAYYVPIAALPADVALMPGLYAWIKANVPMFAGAIDC